LFQILAVLGVSFFAQSINSSLGMLYGTITSAVLVGFNFPPLVIVPAILATEAFADFIAANKHLSLKNLSFLKRKKQDQDLSYREEGPSEKHLPRLSRDLKISAVVIVAGSIASVLAAMVAINIPSDILKTYIGSITLVLGMLLLVDISYTFSWIKILFFGLISAFVNTLGGGGFGAFLTSGQIVSGRDNKKSVAVTTFSESVISLVGFSTYWILQGIHDWEIIFFLCFGAFWGAKLVLKLTNRLQPKTLRRVLGLFVIGLSFLILARVWLNYGAQS